MYMCRPPRSRNDFQTAIICTLPAEADAIAAMFDEYWDRDRRHTKAPGDTNAYITGRIGNHNVILAFVPGMGKGAAAGVAGGVRSSFPQVKLALVVGVCGGVPYTADGEEILLGDVVISEGIVQYDFGKRYPDQFIRRDDMIHGFKGPNVEVRSFIAKMRTKALREHLSSRSAQHLSLVGMVNSPLGNSLRLQATYPGPAEDKLFEATYHHKHHDDKECRICSSTVGSICHRALASTCQELGCDEKMLVPRQRLLSLLLHSKKSDFRVNHNPVIHFGLIASGDTVMKSSIDRDTIAARENVIAYEMEGAGVWDIVPCVLIKGVCDYSDSHKNKRWQSYAAMTAAACLKAFLEQWPATDMRAMDEINQDTENNKPPWTAEIGVGGDVASSIVSNTLTNTDGINIVKKNRQSNGKSDEESIPSQDRNGRGEKSVLKSRGSANKSHLTVNIQRDVSQSVVASFLENSGGINLQ